MRVGGETTSFTSVHDRALCRGMVCVFLIYAATLTPVFAASPESLIAQPAPDFSLKSISGENLRLSEYRGEVVLVNFWVSWCGPCREQMEILGDLHTQFHDQGLNILSVSIDRKSKRATELLEQLQPEYPVLIDDQKTVSRLYDLGDMPFTMLVDHSGAVRAVYEGFKNDDVEAYQTQIAALVAE